MEQIPDEPSIARVLRTGYPQKAQQWNREDIWEIWDGKIENLVNKKRAEKGDTLRFTE